MISWRRLSGYAVVLLSISMAWLFGVYFVELPEVVLPSPTKVAHVFTEEGGMLFHETYVTLGEALLGYALANVLAIGLALSITYLKWSQAFITPWLVIVKTLPIVTVAGALTILLGDTLTPKIIIVILACSFPLVSKLVEGLQSADPALIDRMRVLNASCWQIFWKVRWSAALPYYVAAHEICFMTCVSAAILAEWFFSHQGLGYLIVQATREYRTDQLYAVMLIAGVIAMGTYCLCRIEEVWLFRWKRPRAF